MPKRLVPVLVALVAALVPFRPTAAEAAPVAPGDHCVVHVTGQEPSGELTVSAPHCYDSHAAAMRAEGVTALLVFELGYHCDGYNLVAPCTSVVGDSCTGGWLNTSAFWSNRISSTRNGCPTIRHFDLPNLGGSLKTTSGTGPHNLTTFNNRTESLQYL